MHPVSRVHPLITAIFDRAYPLIIPTDRWWKMARRSWKHAATDGPWWGGRTNTLVPTANCSSTPARESTARPGMAVRRDASARCRPHRPIGERARRAFFRTVLMADWARTAARMSQIALWSGPTFGERERRREAAAHVTDASVPYCLPLTDADVQSKPPAFCIIIQMMCTSRNHGGTYSKICRCVIIST